MHLAWNDHPGQTVPHFPQGACACGADLAGTADLGVRYSHQVTDLPEARAQTIQHDRRPGAGAARSTSRAPRPRQRAPRAP
jgi:hypothetical protein